MLLYKRHTTHELAIMINDENTEMENRNRNFLDVGAIPSAKTQLEAKPHVHSASYLS